MIEAVLVMAGLALLIGTGLLVTGARLGATGADAAVDRINQLLPQSQCAQCGYPGCRPYAAAILRDEAPINRCAPGGDPTIAALARLLQRSPQPLDTDYGTHQPARVAVIDEALCIGCARCLEVCPVDAIVGAPRFMHTVLAAQCTGCELCLPPCPVDCITLEPAGADT
ncbi:MAG: electron transport complex subunit RsxB [Chromatiales bacterium]|nr:MAG: electron transport complex subunit RsxB [Chromatiales bacterium]